MHTHFEAMSNRAATVIEDAPVELWRELFEYFDASDLWFSVRGLNRRIDAILDRTPLDLKLRQRGKYAQFMKTIHLSMNAANVRSLSLHATEDIKHFFSFHPLGALVQLRSLHLSDMFPLNDPSFQSWKPLSSLKDLRSLKVIFSKNSNSKIAFKEKDFLIRSLFEPDFYPALRRFSVEIRDSTKSNPTIRSLNPTATTINLRYLSIDTLTFHDLVKLLPALGNIKSLCISVELCTNDKPTEKLPKANTPLLPKCLRLDMKFGHNLTFERVEYLLEQTPNVECLIIESWSQLIDANEWESLLSTRCPELMKLQFVSLGFIGDRIFGRAMFDFEEECDVSLFWLQHGVEVAHVLDKSEIVIIFVVAFELLPEDDDS